jgi:hypothetical protein
MGWIPIEVISMFKFTYVILPGALIASGSSWLLKEMCTKNLPWIKGGHAPEAEKLTAISERILQKCGSLNVLQPCGSPWPLAGTVLVLYIN